MQKKSLFYKITLGIALLITFIALIVIIAWGYLYYKNQFPQTTETTYVGGVIDVNGEEHSFMELNYYSNFNETGKEVAELVFNFYTDENMTNVKSLGIQRVTNLDEEGHKTYEYFWYDIAPEVNIAWSSIQEPVAGPNANPMYIDINDELFAVQLSGTYTKTTYYAGAANILWGIISNIFTGRWSDPNSYGYYEYETINYTYEDFFKEAINHLTNSSQGYGEYSLPLVNLSEYFSVKKVDEESGQWVEANKTTFNFNYFNVDCNNSRYGMVYASQSFFDMVAEDFEFNISGLTGEATEYWRHYINYYLDENSFDLIETEDGYYLEINNDTLNYISQFDNLQLEIELDLDSFTNINILGLDVYGLFGVNTGSLKITSTTQRDFELKDYSLWDTNLKQLIHSDTIEIICSEYASNSDYEEVII